jgi:kinesin family member 11
LKLHWLPKFSLMNTDIFILCCFMLLQDYQHTGETPVRSEPDVPSKGVIESLRAMPMDALMNEFRENHPYESSKEPKPSLIPRSPLATLN